MSHADHEWAREQLAAHLAGGLSAEERARLEAHAATCAECIAELDALRRFEREMEDSFAPVRPQPGLEERVIRQLRVVPFRSQRPLALKIASAAAAIVLMGVVGFAVMNFADQMEDRTASASLKSLATVEADFRANDRRLPNQGSGQLKNARELARAGSDLEIERPRDVFGRRGIPKDDASAVVTDEPAIFFPEAKESDHNESADTEDYKKAKGESKDFFGPGSGQGGGLRGRQAGDFGGQRSAIVGEDEPRRKNTKTNEGFYSYRNDAPAEVAKADPGAFRPGAAVPAPANPEAAPAPKPDPKPLSDADKSILTMTGGKRSEAANKIEDQGQQQPPAQARKLIRSGDMEFEVESFDTSVVKIDAIAGEEQGVIATVNSEKLPNGKVRGTVVVRVPPDRLGTLIIKLRALGDLKSQKLGSEDITKAYYDLESRLRAARAMEERLLKIIKDGTGAIKDLLLAEKELGEWRTKIETYEGEKRYYDNLVSMSTLTITLFEKEIRSPFGVTEIEQVNAGVEVEDVEKSHKDLSAAVLEAKGRITKSDLKKHAAGQFEATLHFEVAPEASGALRDRLKQLGTVARLDVNTLQQVEGGSGRAAEVKVKRNDTQFFVNLYNLANVEPRLTVHLNLACIDAEKSYKAILDRVEKAAGRVKTSNLDRQKSDQTTGTVDFQVKKAEAEAVLADVRALGETMMYQVVESSDREHVTRSKRGFIVRVAALGTVQPRETTTIRLAANDVAVAYAALSEAVRKAEGRMLVADLNENDRRNITATLCFDVRRESMKGVDEALKAAGEIYSRTSNRAQDAQNVVDSKIKFDLRLFPVSMIPPRESVTLALEVGKVESVIETIQKIVAEAKGKVKDSQHRRNPDGSLVSRLIVDVPYRDRRAVAGRMKELGTIRVEDARPNTAVPDSDLAIAQFDVTVSNDVIVPSDSAPWASIKKGFSVSALALSWSLTLVMIGLCFIVPIGAIVWGIWKVARRAKKQPAATA